MLLVVAVGAAACSSSKGSDGGTDRSGRENAVGVTTSTLVAGPSECGATSIDEVRSIFGGPVAASSRAGLCHYDVKNGSVSLALQRLKKGAAGTALTGVPVADLGDLATWTEPEIGRAGLLQVRKGDAYLQIVTDLSGNPDTAKARAVGWAKLVLLRLKDDPDLAPKGVTTTVPGGIAEPCKLLDADAIRRLTGMVSKGVEDSTRGTCAWSTKEGGSVVLGPITPNATPKMLADTNRFVVSGGKTTPWPRETVKGVGDGTVVLFNPGNPGNAELDTLVGTSLLHVSSTAIGKAAAKDLAVQAAKEAITHL